MFDAVATAPLTLSNATIVTPEGLIEGTLRVDGGRIAGFATNRGEGVDLSGALPDPRHRRPAHRPCRDPCPPA